MRFRAGLCLLICCGAVAACAATPSDGAHTTVTTPAVGKPPAPISVQAALSGEAFTAYAELGVSSNDGLAPGETYAALYTACLADAGYGQYADSTSYPERDAAASSQTLPIPFGPWGYIGTTEAALNGFKMGGTLAINSPNPLASLPAGPQAATRKCLNILADFNNAQVATSLAGIGAMSNAISADMVQDPNFKNATKAWSACMARNGYSTPDANTLMVQEAKTGLGSARSSPNPAENEAQIAVAVADAQCTEGTDLDGIYFAVQASYERQIVSANQQALSAAVRQYKASYASELSKLPELLRTTSATLANGASQGAASHAG